MSEDTSETDLFVAEKDLVGYSPYDGSTISVPKGTVLMQSYFDEYSVEYMMVEELKEVCFHRSVDSKEYTDPANYDKYFAGVDGAIAMSTEERMVYVGKHLDQLLRSWMRG